MKTYRARAERWQHGWELAVEGEHRERETGQISPLVTQSHGLADAHRMVADLIETWTGEPMDNFAVEITFRFEPGSPDERDQLLRDLEDTQRELADAEHRLVQYEPERRG